VVSVNKYLQKKFTHTHRLMGEREEIEEANDTKFGERAVYKRNKYIAGERECVHNLSLEYGSAPD